MDNGKQCDIPFVFGSRLCLRSVEPELEPVPDGHSVGNNMFLCGQNRLDSMAQAEDRSLEYNSNRNVNDFSPFHALSAFGNHLPHVVAKQRHVGDCSAGNTQL